eukprot:jgi/Tetstr1/432039/TSEL_021511.t2
MRNALHCLEIAFPLLLCYGCVAHLLDLLCEDYAKLLDQVIDDATFIVVFVTSHERLRQMFLRFKSPTGIGLRTLPDTRFSYVALMLRSILDNCMNLRELLDRKHDAEYEEATSNKIGTRVANVQRFRDLIGNMRFWDQLQAAHARLSPLEDSIRFIEGDNTRMSYHVRTILGKYCSSPAELDATMLEFNEFIAGVGIFTEARQAAMAEAKERYARLLSAWRAEHQRRDPSHTQMAIMRPGHRAPGRQTSPSPPSPPGAAGATLTMARAAAAGRQEQQLFPRSVVAEVLALALVLCHWQGLVRGVVTDHTAGGRSANPKRYPYMASLRDPNTQDHFCAGALIETTMILTAAHCLDDRASPGAEYQPLVVMGWECDETCNDEERQLAKLETIGTVDTFPHQLWRGTTSEGDDLAILILERPMTKPLLRVRPQPELWPHRTLTFPGWGLDGGRSLSDNLKVAQLLYRPNDKCQSIYTEALGGSMQSIWDGMMCAGGFGTSTCKGDSGGPLIVAGETYEEDIGVGILSFGAKDCLVTNLPSVFTRLAEYQEDLDYFLKDAPSDPTGNAASSFPAPTPGPALTPTPAPTPSPVPTPFQVFSKDSLAPSALSGNSITFNSPSHAIAKTACWAAPRVEGNVSLSLGDNTFKEVAFSAGFTFPFYGHRYSSVFVGSNGYLTFGEGDTRNVGSAAGHSRLPRVSGLFTDLVPDTQSSVKYLQTAGTFVVIYHNMQHSGSNNERSSFWITLGRSGQVTLSYGEVAGSSTAVIGLSSGSAPSSEAALLQAYDLCPVDAQSIQTAVLRHLAQSNPSKLESWLEEGSTACDFEGVGCDGEGVVITVHLDRKALTGSLPPSWSSLTRLETLWLHDNWLTGPLPPSWSALTRLEQLWLRDNELTGPLPPSWSALTRLTGLWLRDNELAGPVPPSWSALTRLTGLSLYANQLTGPLPPSWSALTRLTGLSLSTNQLTGPLPPGWSALTGLDELWLDSNELTGPVPPSWSALTGLDQLYLYTNELTGPLPPSWSALTGLTYLSLYANQLTGPLPPSWSALTALDQLSLSTNQLTGPLPPSWSALTGLGTLWLDVNELTGPVPPSWSALTGLETLEL